MARATAANGQGVWRPDRASITRQQGPEPSNPHPPAMAGGWGLLPAYVVDTEQCGDERAPPSACRIRSMKLRAVQFPVRECKRKAALTTPGRTSTARWCGSGKQHRTVYVRNQHLKAPQERTTSSNLADMGWVAVRIPVSVGRTLLVVDVAAREAMEKACGRIHGEAAGA